MRPANEERIRRLIREGDIVGDVATLTSAVREMLDDIAAIGDSQWNAALLALGRRWYSRILTYAPEERHEVRKEIYALWRGEKKEPLFDENGAQIGEDPTSAAIDAGLREEES